MNLKMFNLTHSENKTGGCLKRADKEKLRDIFNQYATQEKNGEKYMTPSDFVQNFLGFRSQLERDLVEGLAGIVDTDKDGLISFSEFQEFEGLLCMPDAIYRILFRFFDTQGNGAVSFNEFVHVMRVTALHRKVPVDKLANSDLIELYFGKKKRKTIGYEEFSQLLHDFRKVYAKEAFKVSDKKGSGFISIADFRNIELTSNGHLLGNPLQDNLNSIVNIGDSKEQISFPTFMAFNSLLDNIESIKCIYLNATNNQRNLGLTRAEFLRFATIDSSITFQITPLEVDILYGLCGAIDKAGKITYDDLRTITSRQCAKQPLRYINEIKAMSKQNQRGVLTQILDSTYRFFLGCVAGGLGSAVLYPVDLVKTRIQSQRTELQNTVKEPIYKGSFDCFRKVLQREGFFGLYRGLATQLIGVCPEKAAKLVVNDFVKDKFMDQEGNVSIFGELLAGACAGAAQVAFTNPIEIVKIRMQLAGETGKRLTGWAITKDLGFRSLYKGVKACFLRDIPFSIVYFPAYTYLKRILADNEGYNSPLTLFIAGASAGVPAAALVTPADVIKTRLQALVRKDETDYTGLMDCARKIYKEEGFSAFWKGASARVFRIAPQFGIMLLAYEEFQRLFAFNLGGHLFSRSMKNLSTSGLTYEDQAQNPQHLGGYRMALPIFRKMETNFNLYLPEYIRNERTDTKD